MAAADAKSASASAVSAALTLATTPAFAMERYTVMTFNVWNTERLAMRTPALTRLFQTFAPDVVGLQEVRPEVLALIDAALPTHARVTTKEKPWSHEGNVYWNSALFECLASGTHDIGMIETHRRLFWVKLKNRLTKRVLVFGNAHLTWEGSAIELVTGASPRNDQATRMGLWARAVDPEVGPPSAKSLPYPVNPALASSHASATSGSVVPVSSGPGVEHDGIAVDGVVLMGDMNDRFHPRRVLRAESGYTDVFGALHLPQRTTWPTPSFRFEEDDLGGADNVADWMFTHPNKLRAVSAQVVEFALDAVYPSDHYPLMAVLQPVTVPHAIALEHAKEAEEVAEHKKASSAAAQQLLKKVVHAEGSAAAAAGHTATGVTQGKGPASAIAVSIASPNARGSVSKAGGGGGGGAGSGGGSVGFAFPIPTLMIAQVKAARPKRTDDQIKAALIDTAFDVDAAIKLLA